MKKYNIRTIKMAMHPNGGEQTDGTSHFVECSCVECGIHFI